MSQTIALQERTDAKLRYARIHLNELIQHGPPDGSDFDKAHQESFLFHLLCVRDTLLAELNHYYQAGLAEDALSPGKVRDALKAKNISSPELATLYALDQDENSWYYIAKIMRDHSAHAQGAKRAYFLGGPDHQKVKLKHPKSGLLTDDFHLEFERWHKSMEQLATSIRASAIASQGVGS